jgi:hypothetical protein
MSDAPRQSTQQRQSTQRPLTRQPHSPKDRALIPAWAWAAAAALLFLAAYTTWQAQHLTGEFAVLQSRASQEQQRSIKLQSQQQRYQQALNIVAATATRQLQLQPIAPRGKENVPVITAYWNQQLGLALSADKMPPLPSGRTLQLWMVPPSGAPTSAGTFGPNESGQILFVMLPDAAMDAAMNAAKSLAITNEPASGSAQPTSAFEWSVSLH